MRAITLLAVTLIVTLHCIYYTNGLRCYECTYQIADEDEEVGDKSCEFGKPNMDLSVECSIRSLSLVHGVGVLQPYNKRVTAGEFLASRGLSAERVDDWVCAKIFIDGEVKGRQTKVRGVVRTCYPLTEDELVCKNHTVKGWEEESAASGSFWDKSVAELVSGLTDNSLATACLCDEDNCNVEGDSGNTTAI